MEQMLGVMNQLDKRSPVRKPMPAPDLFGVDEFETKQEREDGIFQTYKKMYPRSKWTKARAMQSKRWIEAETEYVAGRLG